MFNHSRTPNINYIRDYNTNSIRYTTSREVGAGEELCTFYGTKLWFKDSVDADGDDFLHGESEDCEGDSFLKMIDLGSGMEGEGRGKVVQEEELPFEALEVNNLVQEEDSASVRTSR